MSRGLRQQRAQLLFRMKDLRLHRADAQIEHCGDVFLFHFFEREHDETGAHALRQLADSLFQLHAQFDAGRIGQFDLRQLLRALAFALAQEIEAHVHHDAKQIRAEPRAELKLPAAAIQFEKRGLHRVFSLFFASEHAQAHAQERLLEMAKDDFIRAHLTGLQPLNDFAFIVKLTQQKAGFRFGGMNFVAWSKH